MSETNGTNAKKPLWPNGLQIEVIGLTGDYASGKTLFGLSILPGPQTLIYDTEKSSGLYQSLGFVRVDLPDLLLKKHGGKFTPMDAFLFWREHVRSLKPGQYRVIVLDTVSEIEGGVVEYVRRNPREFGYTENQFASAQALMWGAVKDFWKSILSDLASRCECFVFTSHLRELFRKGEPTGKKGPKGKSTLMELASLYLNMERKADMKGKVPDVPSAVVRKSRLADTSVDPATGAVVIRPILPPHLPYATPAAIRNYITSPPDYAKLKKDELAPEEVVSEAEIQSMKLQTAEAERDTEMMRNERLARAAATTAAATSATASKPTTAATPSTNGTASTAEAARLQSERDNGKPDDPIHPFGNAPTVAMLSNLKAYKQHLGISDEQWKVILGKRGVDTAKKLSTQQAEELVATLAQKYADKVKREKEAKESNQPVGAGSGN